MPFTVSDRTYLPANVYRLAWSQIEDPARLRMAMLWCPSRHSTDLPKSTGISNIRLGTRR